MAKQIQKNHLANNHFTLIIASVALVLSLMSMCAIWQMDQNTRLWTESDFRNDMETNKRHARLEFCYTNSIRPCDDIAVREFNERPENKTSGNIFPL